MEQVIVAVPRGIPNLSDGGWLRQVMLRRLVGHDERFLADLSHMPLHARVISFLEKVASFEEGETAMLLRRLSIGDRAALMLHARRLELGDNLDCTISCTKCGKEMSLVLSAEKLLNTKHPEPNVSYHTQAGSFDLRIRPLTALDQENLLNAKGDEDPQQALARSCVASSDPSLPEQLPIQVIEAIGLKLEQVDPLSNLLLGILCPECGHRFRASFNVEDFVLQELRIGSSDLDSEVHQLAFHYHWSENDILSLPVQRRRKYISLINSALSGGGSA